MTKADGSEVTVKFDEDLKVTRREWVPAIRRGSANPARTARPQAA
jgi:hypothetical protein